MKEIKECLVCGNKDLKIFCDLGQMPLVNNLKNSLQDKDIVFPLVVMECSCTHKQLSVAVDRELLFKDYLYQTGASAKHIEFFMDFAWGIDMPRGKILDIGCNDGSLLSEFKAKDWEVFGIEPTKNFNEILFSEGIPFLNEFFPSQKAKYILENKRFDAITAFNVFAHNEDPKTFLIEMAKLLKSEGRIYILTTPARLDNFYHEHISYFSPQSMMALAQRCSVEVVSFKTVSMHGESYLFEIAQKKERKQFDMFSLNIIYTESIIAYGASASETVLFNYYKINPEYVVDDNPLKQGKFIPGINSPIVSPDHLVQDKRDLTIICAHHLFDEIKDKIKKLRPKHKDQFVRLI